jgi:uncharacterized membrane protein
MPTAHALLPLATALALIGSAAIGGVFFAFSTFVLRALSRRPAPEAIAAMQAINVAVINPLFLGLFLGTAATCAAASALAFLAHSPTATRTTVGSLLYLLGTFGVTLAFNVPLNNTLAPLDLASPEALDQWSAYARPWTRWNHVRTIAALAAATFLTLAFRATP